VVSTLLQDTELPEIFSSLLTRRAGLTWLKRRTLKLSLLLALYTIPTSKLIQMFNKLEGTPEIAEQCGLDGNDLLRVLNTRRHTDPSAKTIVEDHHETKQNWLLRKKFGLGEDEQIVATFPCLSKRQRLPALLTLTTSTLCFDTKRFADQDHKTSVRLMQVTGVARVNGLVALPTSKGLTKGHGIAVDIDGTKAVHVVGLSDRDAVVNAICEQAKEIGHWGIHELSPPSKAVSRTIAALGLEDREAISEVRCDLMTTTTNSTATFLLFSRCVVVSFGAHIAPMQLHIESIDRVDVIAGKLSAVTALSDVVHGKAPDASVADVLQLTDVSGRTVSLGNFDVGVASAKTTAVAIQRQRDLLQAPTNIHQVSIAPQFGTDRATIALRLVGDESPDKLTEQLCKKLCIDRSVEVSLGLWSTDATANDFPEKDKLPFKILSQLKESGAGGLVLRPRHELPHLRIPYALPAPPLTLVGVPAAPWAAHRVPKLWAPPGHDNLYVHLAQWSQFRLIPLQPADRPLHFGDVVCICPVREGPETDVIRVKRTNHKVRSTGKVGESNDIFQIIGLRRHSGPVNFGDEVHLNVCDRVTSKGSKFKTTDLFLSIPDADHPPPSSFDQQAWTVTVSKQTKRDAWFQRWSFRLQDTNMPRFPQAKTGQAPADSSSLVPDDEVNAEDVDPVSADLAMQLAIPRTQRLVSGQRGVIAARCECRAGFPPNRRGAPGKMFLFDDFLCFLAEPSTSRPIGFTEAIPLSKISDVRMEAPFFVPDSLLLDTTDGIMEFTRLVDENAEEVAKRIGLQIHARTRDRSEGGE